MKYVRGALTSVGRSPEMQRALLRAMLMMDTGTEPGAGVPPECRVPDDVEPMDPVRWGWLNRTQGV